jgi:hypothetical protein
MYQVIRMLTALRRFQYRKEFCSKSKLQYNQPHCVAIRPCRPCAITDVCGRKRCNVAMGYMTRHIG